MRTSVFFQTARRWWVASLLLCCASAFAADSPGLALAQAWLQAFNADEPAQLKAFDDRYHPQRPLADAPSRDFRQRTGGFELVRVERDEATLVQALLKEKASPRLARMQMQLSSDNPPRLLGMMMRPVDADAAAAPAPQRMDGAQLASAVRTEADKAAAEQRFAGTVLLAQGEQVLLDQAWGLADREAGTPMATDSRLRIGSMNKMFTAVAVLQFVQAGRLKLDDPVGPLLGGDMAAAPMGRATVRQLLTHQGGTGDIFGPEFDAQRLQLRSHADYVRLFGQRALAFEPGSRRSYSNFGFVLLGALIEKLSGTDYETHLRHAVFEPAGMAATGTLPESEAVPGRTRGYQRTGDQWVRNDDTLPWRGTAAGGGYSTSGDLLRFARALQSGRLLGAELLAQATQGPGYGLGFGSWGQGDNAGFGHNGGAPGMNGELRIWPQRGLVLVVLSNLDPPSASWLADFVSDRL